MDSTSKKRFLFKVVAFLFILACLVQVFSVIPRQKAHEKNKHFWPYFFQQPKDSLDIIYMGSSHSVSTFIPEIVDDILGTHSLHVSTSGESIYQTAIEYREVLRRQNPKVIVMESYPIFDGLAQDELKPWNYSFFFAVPSLFRQMQYAQQFFSTDNLIYFYLPFTIFHADWKKPESVMADIKDAWTTLVIEKGEVELPQQGYANYMESLPQLKPGASEKQPPTDCPITDMEERLAVVRKIIALSEASQPRLMFVEAPQLLNDFEACREQVIDGTRAEGGDYQVLLQGKGRSRLWFGDHEHMTQFGAIIASVDLAQLLSQKLDLPVNEDALAYYRTYFFKDYTVTRTDDEVTVRLLPYDKSTAGSLKYKWMLFSSDGQKVDAKTGIGKNEMTFTLPDPQASYYLHVEIFNLSGGYFLRGDFEVPSDED